MSTKRILSLVLALVMVLGTFGTVFAAPTASDKLAFLLENGILKEGKADQDLKRRDSVVLLSRLMKEEAAAAVHPASDKYDDIEDPFYNGYIGWATEKGYVNGKENGKFDPNGPLTAQAFATMLLRALGYQEGGDLFDEAYAIGKDYGIFEDVVVGEKEVVTRGDMAAMTYNALGVKMNGQDKTLAEVLGIEMPKTEVVETEAKVLGVEARNYKEITVKVNDLSLFDNTKGELETTENYRVLDGRFTGAIKKVQKVTLNEETNEITLLLDKAYSRETIISSDKAKNDHSLVIRNMTGVNRVLNGNDYRFIVRDNEIPALVKAQYLGKKGIKLTATEPIAGNVPVRNFRVLDKNGNDKNIVMNLEIYDRELILTPYGSEKFDLDVHEEIKVLWVEDYANMRSAETVLKIEDPEADYEEAPAVLGVKAYDNKLEVKFDREIYSESVSEYKTATNRGNVAYKIRGRVDEYAKKANLIDANTVVYEFEKILTDRYTTVDISGLQNHSEVKMAAVVNHEIELILDRSEPIVVKEDIVFLGDDKAQVVLSFDKNIKTIAPEHTNAAGLVDREFYSNYLVLRKYNDTTKIYDSVKLADLSANALDDKVESIEIRDNVVTITFRDMVSKEVYELETSRFEEKGRTDNRMFAQFTQIVVPSATGGLYLVPAETTEINNAITTRNIGELRFTFNQKLDRIAVENQRNYIFTDNRGDIKFLDDLGGEVELDRNGTRINIIFPGGLTRDSYEKLEILKGVKGLSGTMLDHTVEYTFGRGNNNAKLYANGTVFDGPNFTDGVINTKDVNVATIADPNQNKVIYRIDGKGETTTLNVNVPNGDVIVTDFTGTINVYAIGEKTLTLGANTNGVKVNVRTAKEFNIVASGNFKLEAVGVDAKVRVNGGAVTPIKKDGVVEVAGGVVPGVNAANSSVTSATYNNETGAKVTFVVAGANGKLTDEELGAMEVVVNGKDAVETTSAREEVKNDDNLVIAHKVTATVEDLNLKKDDVVKVVVNGVTIGSVRATIVPTPPVTP